MTSFIQLLRIVLLLSLLTSLSIGTGFYIVQKKELRRSAEEELTTIEHLKIRQILEWRKERIADAKVLIANQFITGGLAACLVNRQKVLPDDVRYYFHQLQENYEYEDILFVDTDGEIILSMSGTSGPLHAEVRKALTAAFGNRQPQLSEMHTEEFASHPHISLVAPIISGNEVSAEILGGVVLLCNALDFLYPIIQTWPIPSETAETLLVIRDDDNVLFLNNLRHRKNTALKFRLPMTRKDLPAVMALQGREGIVQGKDYRGIDVIASLHHIPGTQWFMVNKKDKDEAFSLWRSLSVFILGSLIGLMLLTGSVFILFWQRDQKIRFLTLYQSEKALRESEKKFLITLESIGDGVITTDASGRVDLLNPVAEELTGWRSEEARGKELPEIFHIINESTRENAENPVERVLRDGVVVGLANHAVLVSRDGGERPIADSGAPIINEERQIIGVVMVFRDVTEERKTEKLLLKSRRILDATGKMARIGGWEHDLSSGKATWTSTLFDIVGVSSDKSPPGVLEHLDRYPPPDRERLEVAYSRAVRDGNPFDLELQVYTEEKKLLWCRVYGEPVFKDGKCVKMRGTFQDITERKKIELAILESRRQMQTLLGNLPGMAYRRRYEPEWPMEFVSKGVFELTGYTESEILDGGAVSYGEITYPEDRPAVLDAIRQAVNHCRPFEIEYRILTKNGQTRYVCERGQAVVSRDKAAVTVLEGFITDISTRKEAEQSRDEAKKWLDLALASSRVGLWDWTPLTNQIYLSAELKEHLGYHDDEFTNNFELLKNHVHPRDKDNMMHTMHEYLDGRLPKYAVEFRLRHKDGSYRWIFSQGEAVRDDKGQPIHILGSHVDITALKDTEEALIREKEKAELYLNLAPFIVVGLDTNADIFLLNDRGAEILGSRKEDALGKNWMDLFVPEQERTTIRQIFTRIMQGDLNSVEFIENTVVTPAGTEKQILWQNTLLRDASGKITGTISSGVDITERKREEEERSQLQNQLNQAQRMESVGRLAGGVAHDFNNMLQLILGHTDMALDEAEPGSNLHKDLEKVYNAAERAASLTGQLLAFARKQQVTPKNLDMNLTVGSMLKMLRRLIGEDIDLTWKPRPNLWPVLIDPSQVDQILANLCINARDAISGTGKLIIETGNVVLDEQYCADHHGFHPGEFALLAVSDDGCGMDQDTLANIFDPFFTTKPLGKGTGLGLATVYGIVKQNNGFINVYSEPGHGTTFKIYLPRNDADRKTKDALPGAALPLSEGETVLLVEDEPAVLDLGRNMLERLGYIVHTAHSPDEAIQIVENNCYKIDMLITDVIMPNMNGKDLALCVQQICTHLKILFMSGYTADVIAHRGVLDETVGYIQKPFSINDLAQKVRETLDRDQQP